MRILRLVFAGVLLAVSSRAQHRWLPLGTQVSDGSPAQELSNVYLGFPFTWPSGSLATFLVADRYGRVLENNPWIYSSPGYVGQMAGYSAPPTLFSSIHVMSGGDFTDPNAGVWFYTDNATVAAVTWTRITFSGSPGTFQLQLFADGRIVMLYDSLCAIDDDQITAVGLDLGFPMAFPDGNTYQSGE